MKLVLPTIAIPLLFVSCASFPKQTEQETATEQVEVVSQPTSALPETVVDVQNTQSQSSQRYTQRTSKYGDPQGATDLPSDYQLKENRAPISSTSTNVFTPPSGN